MVQPWMRGVLLIGAVYNIAWALFLYWKPGSYIKWISEGEQTENPWVIYQAIGVGIIGLCMFLSTLYPIKLRWLIVLTFIAKLLGGLFVYQLIMEAMFTKKFMFHLLMNDLVWLIPLFLTSWAAFKSQNDR
ncbi:hypothetical protein JKA74_05205 [Marivirga sp. S37H4]|uniref:Alkyl hydroperoxide reductase n=1 Tax=Marivirga aurantiaca TaxID=2802615 RepID=A0A934WWX2_9BACT|nr:hypothetical protein [Marivirga aurantiaca]MBK6264426.1 hypothetical protein [Marivirga aurantiaca]